MTWNYRVIAIDYGDEVEYGIYEVYYEGDTPVARTENPVPVVGNTIDELHNSLEYMQAALIAPVLTDEIFDMSMNDDIDQMSANDDKSGGTQ
jgi:hypothetical protein